MWVAIDLLGLLSLTACLITAVTQGIFYSELLTFAGMMFIAAMIDRLRWSIEHIHLHITGKEWSEDDGGDDE